MNTNANYKEVTPRLQSFKKLNEKTLFLKRLKLITRFADIFFDGSSEELRSKRDELKAGIHLLDDPETIFHCEKMIRAFEARLATIPHERYLRKALKS